MSRVDFPTPGSPPTSTRLPGTIPPPRTRLSSSHARARRGAPALPISLSATGCEALDFGFVLPRPAAAFPPPNFWLVLHASPRSHRPAPPQHTEGSGRGEGTRLRGPLRGRVAETRLALARQLNPTLERQLGPPPRVRADEPAQLGVETAQSELGGRCRGVWIRTWPRRAHRRDGCSRSWQLPQRDRNRVPDHQGPGRRAAAALSPRVLEQHHHTDAIRVKQG